MSNKTDLDHDVYKRFANFGVASIYEASNKNGLIDLDLKQIIPNSRVAGPARTLLLSSGGNRSVHEVMKYVRPGEILAITMESPIPLALIGELLALQAQRARVAGILINGAVRDTDAIREMGLPVWSRWISAQAAAKDEIGQMNVPITLGGVQITPGDAIILDGDGGVVIPENRVAKVLITAEQKYFKEMETKKAILNGDHTYDLYGFSKSSHSLKNSIQTKVSD